MWLPMPSNSGPYALILVVVLGGSLLAAITDVRRRRISNFLTIPMLASGLLWSYLYDGGVGLLASAVACVILALPYLVLFLFFGGGAGDAKLMAAIGAWVGPVNGLFVLLAVAVCGTLHAVTIIIGGSIKAHRIASAGETGASGSSMAPQPRGRKNLRIGARWNQGSGEKRTMPYGPAIFAGVCLWSMGVLLWWH